VLGPCMFPVMSATHALRGRNGAFSTCSRARRRRRQAAPACRWTRCAPACRCSRGSRRTPRCPAPPRHLIAGAWCLQTRPVSAPTPVSHLGVTEWGKPARLMAFNGSDWKTRSGRTSLETGIRRWPVTRPQPQRAPIDVWRTRITALAQAGWAFALPRLREGRR